MEYFFCCNTKPQILFKHEITHPYYKYLAYYECPVCGKRCFEIINEKNIKPKLYFDDVATKKLKMWESKIFKNIHGTRSKEYFYFGTFKKTKNGYLTFRTNFNNKKEFLYKQLTNTVYP